MVTVEPYDAFSRGGGAYLGALEVEAGWASRKTTDTPYDQDELAHLFKKVYLPLCQNQAPAYRQ